MLLAVGQPNHELQIELLITRAKKKSRRITKTAVVLRDIRGGGINCTSHRKSLVCFTHVTALDQNLFFTKIQKGVGGHRTMPPQPNLHHHNFQDRHYNSMYVLLLFTVKMAYIVIRHLIELVQ